MSNVVFTLLLSCGIVLLSVWFGTAVLNSRASNQLLHVLRSPGLQSAIHHKHGTLLKVKSIMVCCVCVCRCGPVRHSCGIPQSHHHWLCCCLVASWKLCMAKAMF